MRSITITLQELDGHFERKEREVSSLPKNRKEKVPGSKVRSEDLNHMRKMIRAGGDPRKKRTRKTLTKSKMRASHHRPNRATEGGVRRNSKLIKGDFFAENRRGDEGMGGRRLRGSWSLTRISKGRGGEKIKII